MPKISVIMPTCNRPDLLPGAINSVLNQTYGDWELLIIDDGDKVAAEEKAKSFNDARIRYIKHAERRGGAAARNTGIKSAQGEFIAFLDDDDEWLPEKLEIQMKEFEKTSPEIGFCFSASQSVYDGGRKVISHVPEGIGNYHELVLRRFNGFLTITLIIKKFVFEECGYFDEALPSHQEPDLIIRISKKFKGLGIDTPLSILNLTEHEHIGGSLDRRIKGRQMILDKYPNEYKERPDVLAMHYFQIALWRRDSRQFAKARLYFKKAWQTKFRFNYFLHFIIMVFKFN